MWQDYVILGLQLLFVPSLLPALLGPVKPDRWTCAFTAAILYALAAVFGTLGLWRSVAGCVAVAATWTVLLVQRR